jgi:hypothetical protein
MRAIPTFKSPFDSPFRKGGFRMPPHLPPMAGSSTLPLPHGSASFDFAQDKPLTIKGEREQASSHKHAGYPHYHQSSIVFVRLVPLKRDTPIEFSTNVSPIRITTKVVAFLVYAGENDQGSFDSIEIQ